MTVQFFIIYLNPKITPAVVPKRCTLFEIILLGWICAVHCWMLHTLRGGGFDCLLTLISIKVKHPRPLQVCTIVCIKYEAHRGRGDKGFNHFNFHSEERLVNLVRRRACFVGLSMYSMLLFLAIQYADYVLYNDTSSTQWANGTKESSQLIIFGFYSFWIVRR